MTSRTWVICRGRRYYAGPVRPHPLAACSPPSPPKWVRSLEQAWKYGRAIAAERLCFNRGFDPKTVVVVEVEPRGNGWRRRR